MAANARKDKELDLEACWQRSRFGAFEALRGSLQFVRGRRMQVPDSARVHAARRGGLWVKRICSSYSMRRINPHCSTT